MAAIFPIWVITLTVIGSFNLLLWVFWPKKGNTVVSQIVNVLYDVCSRVFFKEIIIPGKHKIPQDEATILICAPHANQFVDCVILASQLPRKVHFVAAASTVRSPIIGRFCKWMSTIIPVERSQDLAKTLTGKMTVTECSVVGIGTHFTAEIPDKSSISINKELRRVVEVIDDTHCTLANPVSTAITEPVVAKMIPHVDNTSMFSSCWECLGKGGCIAIFPEGGSHDRSDLLPLKSGVAFMIMGFRKKYPEKVLRVIPVGMNYMEGHKFRQACAFIDIGEDVAIPHELDDPHVFDSEESKHMAVDSLMSSILHSIRTVTTTAPDWETFTRANAARRLLVQDDVQINTEQKMKLCRNLVHGYLENKNEPTIVKLVNRLDDYIFLLECTHTRDSDVKKREHISDKRSQNLENMLYHLLFAFMYSIPMVPGAILGWPFLFYGKIYSSMMQVKALKKSSVKVKGVDVVASNKLVAALETFVVMILIEPYFIIRFLYNHVFHTPEASTHFSDLYCMTIIIPWVIYSAIYLYEWCLSHWNQFWLYEKMVVGDRTSEYIFRTRQLLKEDLSRIVEEYGPKVYGPEFYKIRVLVDGYPSMQRVRTTLNMKNLAKEFGGEFHSIRTPLPED